MRYIFIILFGFPILLYSQWTYVNRVDIMGNKMVMVDEETGFIASGDYLYRTDDGWDNYHSVLDKVLILDIALDNKGRIVCVGLDKNTNTMGYQVSLDGGLTWSRINGNTRNGFRRVSVIKDSLFVINSELGIMRTLSGTKLDVWVEQKIDNNLWSVNNQVFNDNGVGILSVDKVGSSTLQIYRSLDFGDSWGLVEGTDTLGSQTQKFCGYEGGFIGVGQNGQMAFYNHNAELERSVWTGIYQSFSDVTMPGGDIIYVGTWFYTSKGLRGTVYRSNDMGRSFEHISPVGNLEAIVSIDFVSTQTGYVLSNYGHVYKTTNGGGDPYPDSLNVPVVVPVDTQKITAIAETGTDESRLRIFPNPAGQTLTAAWDFETPAGGTLLLYNMQGQALMSWPMPQGGKAVLSVADLPLGMYLLRYTTPEKNGAARFVKGG